MSEKTKFERHLTSVLIFGIVQIIVIVYTLFTTYSLFVNYKDYKEEIVRSTVLIDESKMYLYKYLTDEDASGIVKVSSNLMQLKGEYPYDMQKTGLIKEINDLLTVIVESDLDQVTIAVNKLDLLKETFNESSQVKYEKIKDKQSVVICQSVITLILITCGLLFNIFFTAKSNETVRKNGATASCTDELTRVWNRKYIDRVLPTLVNETKNGYLFMIDMDHFKTINDTLGHGVGDEVLKDFARVCKNCLRPSDVVCRLGGDEFMIFSPDLKTDEQANVLQSRLRQSLENTFANTSKSIVTLSCGAVKYNHSKDFQVNYKYADNALYYVKEHGRNGFYIGSN